MLYQNNVLIILENTKLLAFNNTTGLFFEINKHVMDILVSLDDHRENFYEQSELTLILSELKKYHFIHPLHIGYISNMYPKINPYAIWDDSFAACYINDIGHLYKISELDKSIFLLANGNLSVKEIANELKINELIIIETILKWTSYSIQILKLFNSSYQLSDNIFFTYFQSKANRYDDISVINHEEYYRKIMDPQKQFENIETTVSYLLRHDTDILENKEYGAEFCESSMNLVKFNGDLDIMEVGGGTGHFAYSFLTHLCEISDIDNINMSYTICDISEALLSSQKRMCKDIPNIQFINMNAENLTFNNTKFDLIISNEVIADLTNISLDVAQLDKKSKKQLSEIIEKYNLKNMIAKDKYLNIGAIKFIENIYNVLKKSGVAIISEFTEIDSSAQITNCIGDHAEVSINFGILEQVGKVLGFKCKVLDLAEFLNIDKDILILSPESFMPLQLILANKNIELEKLIYPKKYIENLFHYYNMKYCSINDIIKFFKVLILIK